MGSMAATRKGIIAVILLAAIIAVLSVLARFLSTDFTILQQVYLRVFIALGIAIILFHRHLRWHIIKSMPAREWGILAFRGITGYAVGVTLLSQASTMTTIGNVTFIASLPLVPLLGLLLLGEKATWWKIVFILGSFLGVMLLATKDLTNFFAWQPGDLVAILATVGTALSYIARKWHGSTLNNQEITTFMFAFGMVAVFLLSMVLGEGMPALPSSWAIWLALLAAGALNVAKLFLANYGFQHVSAVQAGNLLTLEGVWGVLLGLLIYHEWPTWQGLLGGAIIVGCVLGMNAYSKKAASMAAPPEGPLSSPR